MFPISSIIQGQDIIKTISDNKIISSLTAIYSCKLETDDNELFKIGEINNSISRNKAKIKTETEVKTDKNNNSKKLNKSCFDMTFGYFEIKRDDKRYEDYVFFPFLDSFEINVLSQNSIRDIIPIDKRTKPKDIIDEETKETNNGSKAGSVKMVNQYNCTVKMNFKIPAQLRRNPDAELVFQKLILSQSITSKLLQINYISSPLIEGDDDTMFIFDMKNIDFGDGFNPINSSNGYEELSFSRLFAGYVTSSKETHKLLKSREKEFNKKTILSQEVQFEQETLAKEKKRMDVANETSKTQLATNIVKLEKSIKNKESVIKEIIETNGFSRKGSFLSESEKQSKYYHEPFKVTFLPEEDIDFTNVWYAEDTSTDSPGILQLSIINEYLHNRQYVDHGNYGVFTLKPIIHEKDVSINGDKINLDKNKKSIHNTVTAKSNVSSVINQENDRARSDFSKKIGKAFRLNVVLPRAILQVQVYDLIELRNSVFGVYDGLWRVMQNHIVYSENGQIRQELNLIINSRFIDKYDKKTNVKIKRMTDKQIDNRLEILDF